MYACAWHRDVGKLRERTLLVILIFHVCTVGLAFPSGLSLIFEMPCISPKYSPNRLRLLQEPHGNLDSVIFGNLEPVFFQLQQ